MYLSNPVMVAGPLFPRGLWTSEWLKMDSIWCRFGHYGLLKVLTSGNRSTVFAGSRASEALKGLLISGRLRGIEVVWYTSPPTPFKRFCTLGTYSLDTSLV